MPSRPKCPDIRSPDKRELSVHTCIHKDKDNDLAHQIADDSELVLRDYLCAKQLSTPHQLARLMKEATADRDLVLHHTDTVAFSVATKPDDHFYPPSLRLVPSHSWVD